MEMIIFADRKLREYRDRTEWVMCDRNDVKWCCEDMERVAYEGITLDSYVNDDSLPDINMRIKAGDDYYDGEYCDDNIIHYCPFCGDKIEVQARTVEEVPYSKCLECNRVMKDSDMDKHMEDHFAQEVEKEIQNKREEIAKRIKNIKTEPINYKNYINETRCICNGSTINKECFIHGE